MPIDSKAKKPKSNALANIASADAEAASAHAAAEPGSISALAHSKRHNAAADAHMNAHLLHQRAGNEDKADYHYGKADEHGEAEERLKSTRAHQNQSDAADARKADAKEYSRRYGEESAPVPASSVQIQETLQDCVNMLELSLAEDWENTHARRAGDTDSETLHNYHSDRADFHKSKAKKHTTTGVIPLSFTKTAPQWKSPASKRKGERHLKLMRAHDRAAETHEPQPRKTRNYRWDTISDQ